MPSMVTTGNCTPTWRWLLVVSAAGLLVLSLGQAIVRGDREALALAVVVALGLALLRRRTGALGAGFLSLVFGDVSYERHAEP